MQESESKNFREFADFATRELHDALLREGSRGMNAALYTILPAYIQWVEKQKEKT